jgi:hypothetical protein
MKRIVVVIGISVLFVAVALQAQSPVPKPGPEHKKFEALLGTWMYEGQALKSIFGPAGKVTGTDVYEMLPGGFFLQHHWDENNPLGNVKGLEVWGYDSIKKMYSYNYFNSIGEIGSGTITINGSTWNFAGGGVTYDGKSGKGRCSLTFAGTTAFTVKCEVSTDGNAWAPNFEGKWTKSR